MAQTTKFTTSHNMDLPLQLVQPVWQPLRHLPRSCTYDVHVCLRTWSSLILTKHYLKTKRTCRKLLLHFLNPKVSSCSALYYVTEYPCHKWSWICFVWRNHNPIFSSFIIFHRVRNNSNTTGVKYQAGTAYPSRAPAFTSALSGFRVARSLVFW